MNDYDVIIIGTGAGGGTLARHLAPSGQADPAARARRLASPGAAELGHHGRVRRQPLRLAGHLVRRGREGVPAADPLLRRRRDQALRRRALPPAPGGLRRAAPPRRDLAGLADLLRRHRAVLHARPSSTTRCTAPAARIRPSRRERSVPVPGRLARAADPALARPARGRGLSPVSRAVRGPPRRGQHAVQPLRPLLHLRRLPVPRPREVRRRGARRPSGARARERDAADERQGGQAGDRRGRHDRHRGRRRARRRAPSATRAPSSSLACGAANTAKLLLASANDKHPNGLANGSDQVGRNYMFHASQAVLALSRDENPTVFQKTLGLNDFYFGARRLRVPAREHPDDRQVAAGDVPRREADRDEARARVVARAGGEARDRLLALDRGPAAAREPGHARRRRQRPPRLHPDERRAEAAALREAQVDPRASSTWTPTT